MLREQLAAIHAKHGRLTPELVVQEARAPSHPLHGLVFNKPQAEAAEAYYRERARELIQSVRITYSAPTGDERSIREFYAVSTSAGVSYEPAETVAADPFTRRLVLNDMEREFRQLEARYGHFAEWLALLDEAREAA